MKYTPLAAAILAITCASIQAGTIRASLTGTKIRSSTGGTTTVTPISYNVTIKTDKTGALDTVIIVENGSSSSSDTYSYTGTYTVDQNNGPIPGTFTDTNTYSSTSTKTYTYYFSKKSFGGKVSTANTNANSYLEVFTPTDTSVLPVVTDSSTSAPSSYAETYSDGGLASVKTKGAIVIKLSSPYSYNDSSSTEVETNATTITVRPGKRPKMTLAVTDIDSYSYTDGSPSQVYTTNVTSSGKARGNLKAKVRTGTQKIASVTVTK